MKITKITLSKFRMTMRPPKSHGTNRASGVMEVLGPRPGFAGFLLGAFCFLPSVFHMEVASFYEEAQHHLQIL